MIGSVRTLPYAGNPSHSAAAEIQRALRATRGRLLNVKAVNLSGGSLFLQIHDKATAVVAADVPMFTVPIAAGGFASLDGFSCTNGIVVALSTTAATYTAAGAGAGWFYGETA